MMYDLFYDRFLGGEGRGNLMEEEEYSHQNARCLMVFLFLLFLSGELH
jgi:hypothetical protein